MKPILEGIMSALKQNPKDKQIYLDLLEISKGNDISVPFIRQSKEILLENLTEDLLDVARLIDIRLGRETFLDFLNAIEIDREYNSTFWIRRKNILEGKHKIASTLNEFIEAPAKDKYFLSMSYAAGIGKSALLSFIAAYIMGKNHYARNFYVGYTAKLPNMTFERVKGIIDPLGEYNFKDIFYDFPFDTVVYDNKELTIRIDTKGISQARAKKNDPIFSFVSVDGSITGVTRASGDFENGAGFCMLDDLVEDNNAADNINAMDKLWETYNSKVLSRTLGEQAKIIAVGTLWGINDPICREMIRNENNPRYTFLRFPVEDEKGESNFDFGLAGEGYTKETIAQKRSELNPVDFNCLYMAMPTHKQGRLFPYEDLKLYNGVIPSEDKIDKTVMVCDVAFGGGDSLSAPVAIVCDGEVYITDVVFTREDRERSIPQVTSLIINNKVQLAQFEANNGGDAYARDIERELEKTETKCSITWKKASTRMAKDTRIAQYAPDIRKWYFLTPEKRSVQYQKFIEEVCMFSVEGKNRYDDAPDSLGMLAEFIGRSYRKTSVTIMKRPF